MRDFAGKTALITGGGSGIGLQGIRDNALYFFTASELRLGVEERFGRPTNATAT